MENKTSDSTDVLRGVSREIKKVNLLENNVIVPFSLLQGTISEPKTLNVVEARQFRERGLLHISDAAFAFFLSLEQERVDKINFQRLSSLGVNLVDTTIEEIFKNKRLQQEFAKLFDLESANDQVNF